MANATNHNVVGTDGIIPSYNSEGLWKTWAIDEIFTGGIGKNRYVPKINDHVIEPITNTRYIVKSINMVTLVSELSPIGSVNSLALSANDMLFASGPGWPSQAYRIYLDDTVFPYRLDVDDFLSIRSVDAAYVKIIHGSIYGDHQVVSQVFNTSGVFTTDKVGLDLLALEPGWQNYHIKSVKTCSCSQKFKNGDTLTVVTFSSAGHVLNMTPLSVVNSNFIRDLNAPLKYITHTSLRSPFLSETNPELLLLPLNWTKSSMNIMGVVHYNDGSEIELPIDGRKFTLRGLDQLLSSIPGHEFDMTLNYSLAPSEASFHETSSYKNGINTNIRIKLIDSNYSYSVKLFVYPYWDSAYQGFRLKWFMFNLERNIYLDVTGSVKIAANSQLFDGHRFGSLQRFQISLNLRDVLPTYKAFVHTQIVEISLYGSPVDYPTPWTVKHNSVDDEIFGAGLKATKVTSNAVSIKSLQTNYTDWKTKLYYNTRPLTETQNDPLTTIEPTHFYIVNKGVSTLFPITSWLNTLNLPGTITLYDNVYIVFVRKISTGTLYLSMGALNIQ